MSYVHGYSKRESERLRDQSGILENLLHSGTSYPAGSRVLEAGCGVGAQTRIIAGKSPDAEITSIDISEESISTAELLINKEKISNVSFQQASILDMPFPDECFDHVFVCFVLEHLENPLSALAEAKRVLKPGGSITLIEGDHGSCFWHPETKASLDVWNAFITAQQQLGHDPLIGRRVYPLLKQVDFNIKYVSPRWVYADSSNPDLLDGVVNRIIVPMVESGKMQILESELIDRPNWDSGIDDLLKSGTAPEGTFFYTWFKGVGIKK
ncbi:MAG: methyltransferase domain-containing protein [Deltaproteobacteria bacterium]|nr:methyltransferase domain-containing protein [Deltaproteobacteria bacterium]